jgi:Tfp pilus assembly protein PilF
LKITTPKPEGPALPQWAKSLAVTFSREQFFALGALLVLTALVFGAVLHFDFVNFDDDEYVTGNPQVLHGLTLGGIKWAFTTMHASNWHPVTWLSHMLDVSLFGRGAAAPHAVNLALHLANTALLGIFLTKTTERFWPAFWVTALFALHPLRVESVAWVSERKDVLSTLFWLLTLLFYAAYAKRPVSTAAAQKAENSRSTEEHGAATASPAYQLRYYLLSLAWFALGLMSKPMLVTTPFLLLLIDFWPLGRISKRPAANLAEATWKRLLLEKIPFLALSAAAAAITFMAQHRGGAVVPMSRLPFDARFENSAISYARYLGKFFWPANLAVPYPLTIHPSAAMLALAAIVLAGMSLLSLLLMRRFPFLFTGWFWYIGTLVPVVGLVQVGVQGMADRYTYFPMIGFCIVLVWAAFEIERIIPPLKLVFAIAGAASLALLAWRARIQVSYWQNSGTFFQHAIEVTEGNFVAHDNVGFYLFQKGNIQGAMAEYRKALAINPDNATTYNNMGTAYVALGDLRGAVACYSKALSIKPDYAEAHNNLGVAYDRLNNPADAEKQFRAALRIDPHRGQAHNNLANLLALRGNIDEAIQHYRAALQENPEQTQALNNLAYILGEKGDIKGATDLFSRALKLAPNDAMVHSNYGDLLSRAGRNARAAEHYNVALALNPNLADAHLGLGKMLARMGILKEARIHLQRAVELNPSDPDAQKALKTLDGK